MRDRSIPLVVALSLLGLAPASSLLAQPEEHAHHHGPDEVEGLGDVHFPVGCLPALQGDFDRAVALLHSFGYEQARTAFRAIADRDPACAMARWGEAMTCYHPVWGPPSAADLAAGGAAAAAAEAIPAHDERERGYVAAIATFYRGGAGVDYAARARAYRDAMRALMQRYPDDVEAAIFYAELGTVPSADPTMAAQKESAAILERLRATHPRHPGIIHYLIHAFDYPQTASLALDAARAYAAIAPASPHARHMPSHIFTRLGLWEESIASNRSSLEAAQAIAAHNHPGTTPFDGLHAYDYLEYAYLQLGDDAHAREVRDAVVAVRALDEPAFQAAYALAAVPARYALERHQWQEAAALRTPEADLDWTPFRYAEGTTLFANAIGAARGGDAAAARTAVERLTALHAQIAAAPPPGTYDWAGEVESLRLAAAGWLAHAERHDDEAVRLLAQAADLEERVGKHPVTPGAVLPAREQLGDLLLELDRPDEALTAYQASLATAPNRLDGLRGARRAAERAGAAETAKQLAAQLQALCRAPVCTRTEVAPPPPPAGR